MWRRVAGSAVQENPSALLRTTANTRNVLSVEFVLVTVKGKGHPRTGHEGPKGKEMYSSNLSLTSALDEGGWSTPRPGRYTSGNEPVPIV